MTSPQAPDHALRADVRTAMQNTLKLGASLMGTWAVGLGIRMMLPRFLGPASFGELQFADAFTIVLMMTTTLGLDTYIRREVPTRQEHASEFFGGTMILSALVGVTILLVALPSLRAGGKSPLILTLVALMGVSQILVNLSGNLASMLHAVGKVDGLAVQNVASKFTWGIGIALAFFLGYGVRGVAVAMLTSEIIKLIGMARLARRHVKLTVAVNWAATWPVLRASSPFFVLALAQTIYSRIDVTIMSFLSNDTEVGWYAAASTIAGISLLLSPLIGWVVLPLTQRAAARSHAEFLLVSRRVIEIVMMFAFPVTLAFYVGAPYIIDLAFGKAFAPSIPSLKILAPTFVLTYAAIVGSSLLIRMGRGWVATWISLAGMAVAPVLNLLIVPYFQRRFGVGGAGMGAAACLSLTEIFASGMIMFSLGREFFERHTMLVLLKTMLVGVGVAIMDHFLLPFGIWRLLLDGAAYLGVCLLIGALDFKAMAQMAKLAMAERKGTPPEVVA
jgi:O-antigen/teichoic acid export membrane protein